MLPHQIRDGTARGETNLIDTESKSDKLCEAIAAITVDGKIKAAVTKLVEELSGEKLKEPEKTYRVGQKFRNGYMIVSTDLFRAVLINLSTGNRRADSIKINSNTSITKEEFSRMGGSDSFIPTSS